MKFQSKNFNMNRPNKCKIQIRMNWSFPSQNQKNNQK